MRKLREFLSYAALSAGLALPACPPAAASDVIFEAGHPGESLAQGGMPGHSSQQPTAMALRAQWLARGHSVQELASVPPPAITAGSVKAQTITVGKAGEFPSVSVSYTTGTPGLASTLLTFASPSGQTLYVGQYTTSYYTEKGTESFAIAYPISLYAQPGKWSLSSATLTDYAGNSTTYSASQLKTLFDSLTFTVVNSGPFAKGAPKITAGQLLNDKLSESAAFPVLAANITASDTSGPGIYLAYVNVSSPGGGFSGYSVLPVPLPVKSGTVKANNVFNTTYPTGTWTITGYGVCDYAFNCAGSTSKADVIALFGTDTFTITH